MFVTHELWINYIKGYHNFMFQEMLFKLCNKMPSYPFKLIFHFGGSFVENILGEKLKTNKTIIASLIDRVFASNK